MKKAVFIDCLKRHRGAIGIYILIAILNFVIFKLYDIIMEPFFYALMFSAFCGIILFTISYFHMVSEAARRKRLSETLLANAEFFTPESLAENDYHAMLHTLESRVSDLITKHDSERAIAEDYLTAWVHQIKTPISVIRLTLAETDTPESRAVLAELFRIEQYVEMVLQYIRLGSATNDLVIREYPLDDILRESIRKFAPQFILRKLALHYNGTDIKIVTDKKWLGCIIDQLLSNAVKYTPSGSITITVKNTRISIKDTGIGIAPEDIPRVFERGYTGENGRLNQRASGLGLYLATAAARKIAVKLSAESEIGRGSKFHIDF